MLRYTHRTLFFSMGLFLLAPLFSHAATLQMMSDLILNSGPNVSTSHIIEFTNTNEIPSGGIIKYRFEGKDSPFIFPAIFDYTNMELFVSKGSGFEPLALDSYSDMSTSSVSFIPLGDGEIDIRLAADELFTIPPNSRIRLKVGGNAESVIAIKNPNTVGTHKISISTFDSSEVLIDKGATLVATVLPVGVGAAVYGKEAVLSNGLPIGLLPGGTKKVFISVETNVPAFCRYSYDPNVQYGNMPSGQAMKAANFNRLHSFVIDVVDDKAYNFYLRCFSKFGLEPNLNDYPIKFEVGIVPKEKTPPPPPPGNQAGNNTGGGNMVPQSGLVIEGKTFAAASVVILKDGKEFRTVPADGQGNFSAEVSELDRGTYVFMITAISDKIRSAAYNTVLYVTGSTRNSIGPVYMSPYVTSRSERIDVGSQVTVTGKAVPLLGVQVVVVGPKDPLQQPYVINNVTANGSGDWNLTLDTSKLPQGTYSIRAQTVVPGQGNSQFSPEFLLGIGVKPEGNNKRRSDINGDGKVNIADLSILLFNWKKSSPTSDISMDGIVNITDFSIMLSSWTG